MSIVRPECEHCVCKTIRTSKRTRSKVRIAVNYRYCPRLDSVSMALLALDDLPVTSVRM